MQNKLVSIVVGAVIILGVGGMVYMQTRDEPEAPQNETTEQENAGDRVGDFSERFSASEVAQHANASSCWTIINGTVYDLTSWVPNHPGGQQAILQLCGKDGSEKFNGQHGGQATQERVLAGFKIGIHAD